MVGLFLENSINNKIIKIKMTYVWQPVMRINIKELESGMYLFLYHKEDLQWVLNGGPWSFDNIMLVLNVIPSGENPMKIPLYFLNI